MRPRFAILLVVIMAVGASGCAADASSADSGGSNATHHLTLVVHPTALEFVTTTGASSQLPTGPLSTGDRVLGQDALMEGASVVGHDFETCTVGFELQVFCQDILSLTNRGDVLVSWQFAWGASGQPPAEFQGVVVGGTSSYRGVRGDFDAQSLANHDVRITATISS